MGLKNIIGLIVLVFFYLVPTAIFFIFKKHRGIVAVFIIPIGFTLFVFWGIMEDIRENEMLYKKYPQVNKITFVNSYLDVYDSIKVLKVLMTKLPRRNDHNSVDYEIEKYPNQLNNFTFNWYEFEGINLL